VKILDFGLAARGQSNCLTNSAVMGPTVHARNKPEEKPTQSDCQPGLRAVPMITGTAVSGRMCSASYRVGAASPEATRELAPARPGLSNLVMRLLAKDPLERPPSAWRGGEISTMRRQIAKADFILIRQALPGH